MSDYSSKCTIPGMQTSLYIYGVELWIVASLSRGNVYMAYPSSQEVKTLLQTNFFFYFNVILPIQHRIQATKELNVVAQT